MDHAVHRRLFCFGNSISFFCDVNNFNSCNLRFKSKNHVNYMEIEKYELIEYE